MPSALQWLLQPDLAPLLERGEFVFLAVIAGIIFAESGLLIGFFLPGDSLLFTAGLVSALAGVPNPFVLAAVVFVAAVLGDQCGYLIGRRLGPAFYNRSDGRIFRQEYVTRSQEFFERHGGKAIVLARFVPIVRTFTPVVAGVSRMAYRTFLVFNVIGALAWAVLISMLGHALGSRFPGLEHYITPIIVGIIALSILPGVIQLLRARLAGRQKETAGVR